jgi:lipopolysaccharide/colanic/teichoic acid biosynthesis glycosyltransferase
LKRCIDLLGAFLGLIVISPLLLLITVIIKLTSRGPVFYHWKVAGEGGRYFTSYKFRTMVIDADKMRKSLSASNQMTGPVFKMDKDPRVLPVGRWLRRFSLDELPQLWSVLKGDMSLVGPRPLLQYEYEQCDEWQKAKFAVRPGITCLWQVKGRHRIRDFDEWVRLDLDYINNWSLWLDIRILLGTIPMVLGGRGV